MLRAAGLSLRSSDRHNIHPLVAAGERLPLNTEPNRTYLSAKEGSYIRYRRGL